jgi:hypothetical protein
VRPVLGAALAVGASTQLDLRRFRLNLAVDHSVGNNHAPSQIEVVIPTGSNKDSLKNLVKCPTPS